jgi:hypothetical protein
LIEPTWMKQMVRYNGSVEARSFVLRDARGLPRAELSLMPTGAPRLALLDSDGHMRVGVGVADECPEIVFYDQEGRVRLIVSVRSDGTPRVGLYDEVGNPAWVAP